MTCTIYYVTDRAQFPGDEATRRKRLLEKISEAARAGFDYIQLREKDLPARELEDLAREAVRIVKDEGAETALLVNSRTDVALAVGAHGVHLPSDDISPSDVRRIYQCAANARARVTISVSCHSTQDVQQAHRSGASLALFAPVFGKKDAPNTPPAGLESLRQACKYKIPVLALGGITLENAGACLEAGATGIAAIRLFQENDISEVARQLRNL